MKAHCLSSSMGRRNTGLNLVVVIVAFGVLGVLLLVLETWHQRIAEHRRDTALEDIKKAEERGTSRPLAQHPQIDVQACIGCGACVKACPEEGVLALVEGVARVIHGARCIGHGRCADVCPVNAIQIGLGELARSPNLPVLSGAHETTVPGIFVAGELGGFALIRVAVEQGLRVMDEIGRRTALASRSKTRDSTLDTIIVGAGPAGIAASLRARELGLNYLTIDQDDVGGTVRKYPRRKLTLTGPLALPLHGRLKREEYLKEELIELWEQIIRAHQLRIKTGVKLNGATRRQDHLLVETSEGQLATRNLVLALGRRGSPRKLGIPGEDQEKVLYQLQDAATYENEQILVVGGGDSAVEAAVALASQTGNTVTLSYRRESFFRLKPRNEERIQELARTGRVRVLFASTAERIEPDAVVVKVLDRGVERQHRLRNDHVLVCAGGEPPYPLLRGMGVRFNGDSPATDMESLQPRVEVST